MKRPLPLWLAVVGPATIAGHSLAYAWSGRTMADGHHLWLAPALETSLALLGAVALALLGGALIKARILAHTRAEGAMLALWPRMAAGQLVLFAAIERLEGTSAGLFGCAVQIVVALIAAGLLAWLVRVLATCVRSADEAQRYLERLGAAAATFVSYNPPQLSFALAASAGTHRFQRPPPQP